MSRIDIGVDPGLSGAIAVLCDGKYYMHFTMPTQKKNSGRREINVSDLHALAQWVKARIRKATDAAVTIERVSANPTQGVSGMFSFGDSFGCARCFAAALMLKPGRVRFVSSQAWKAHFGLIIAKRKEKLTATERNEKRAKSKAKSLRLARKLFPGFEKQCKKKAQVEGVSEALLIARYSFEVNDGRFG